MCLQQGAQALQAVGAAFGIAVIAERLARTVAARAVPGLSVAATAIMDVRRNNQSWESSLATRPAR